MYRPLKRNVCPNNLSILIQQRMGKIQISEQPPLYLPVLGGKADQLIHNNRLVIEEQ